MELLLVIFLLILVVLFLLKKKQANVPRPKVVHKPYAAVMIDHQDFPCSAAFDRSSRIYLSYETPKLPLESCDRSEKCHCKYVHYDDRRHSDGDRRVDSPVLRDTYRGDEHRTPGKRGRRVGE